MNRFSVNGDGKAHASNGRKQPATTGPAPASSGDVQIVREQQLIKSLTDRYDEIESLWTNAEEDLKQFRIPRSVEHCYESDYDHGIPMHFSLSWTRYGKSWRICHEQRTSYSEVDEGRQDEVEWKPIIECPLDLRLHMIREFEKLRTKVIDAAQKAVPELDDAISQFRHILHK